MKKLVFISSVAAPHQIKLCYELQHYFNTEFWFYDSLGNRASWWKIELGAKCKLIANILFKKNAKYITISHLKMLRSFNPDIVMLGGFSIPANYFAYLWARKNRKKTIVFTERSRNKKGELRKRNFSWVLLKFLYRHVDMVMVSDKDIVPQFKEEFKFGEKVVASRYASDIDVYFEHPIRVAKKAYNFMFPNRLTPIYDPLRALDIFYETHQKYPGSKLYLNAIGELRRDCEEWIKEHDLEDAAFFLDHIDNWEDLHLEYKKCDIMIFPAKFSNGNFTIIEAMASGLGIIISDKILGIGNLIVNEKNGFNIPPEKEAFLNKIELFHQQPELFTQFAQINRAKVRPLGAKGTAHKYEELINTLF